MRIILLILVFCISMFAQTQDDFQKKYGHPLSESYEVRPDILAVFGYSKNGKTCTLSLESKQNGLKLSETQNDLITEIIDELVPSGNRGENMLSGFASSTDYLSSVANYKNVQITRSTNSKKEFSAVVRWRDKDCESEYGKPFSFQREEFTFSEAYENKSN